MNNKALIERLKGTRIYSGRSLGKPVRNYDAPEGSGTLDGQVILLSVETRDAIVAALGGAA